jgi:hypothetical protein
LIIIDNVFDFQKQHIAVWSILSRIDISVPFVCPVGEEGRRAYAGAKAIICGNIFLEV